MEFVLESLRADWEALLRFAPRLFYGLVLLVFFLAAGRFAGRLVGRVLHKTQRYKANENFFRHAVGWSFAAVGVLLALGLSGLLH